MAYSISEVITLGIGTPSDIPSFLLLGLKTNPSAPTSTGDVPGLSGNSGNSAMTGGADDQDVE